MAEEFKVIVSGTELTMTNPNEIMRMGGPYTCTLSLKDKFISENCIVDNFIFDDATQRLFFIKAHRNHGWMFSINYYSLLEDRVYEFQNMFNMVFIKQFISNSEIEIYHAFHDKDIKQRDVFDIDTERSIGLDKVGETSVGITLEPSQKKIKGKFFRLLTLHLIFWTVVYGLAPSFDNKIITVLTCFVIGVSLNFRSVSRKGS